MKKKVTITLSGGAIKGAFEAGALSYISGLPLEIVGVSGTSVGALNGAMVAQNRIEDLLAIWHGIQRPRDIYKNWIGWWLAGYFKGGLYNFQPMRKKIEKYVDVEKLINSGIDYCCCSVKLRTGEKIYTWNVPENKDVIKDQIWASATIPVTFPPVMIKSEPYIDGGVSEPVPVEVIIKKHPEADVNIIILADRLRKTAKITPPQQLLPIAMRSIDLMFDEIFFNDVRLGGLLHWEGKQYLVIEPPEEFFESAFDVDPDKIRRAMDAGYQAAHKVLEAIE